METSYQIQTPGQVIIRDTSPALLETSDSVQTKAEDGYIFFFPKYALCVMSRWHDSRDQIGMLWFNLL